MLKRTLIERVKILKLELIPSYLLTIQMTLTKLLGIFMTNLVTNFSFMLKWTFLLLLLSLSKKTSYPKHVCFGETFYCSFIAKNIVQILYQILHDYISYFFFRGKSCFWISGGRRKRNKNMKFWKKHAIHPASTTKMQTVGYIFLH